MRKLFFLILLAGFQLCHSQECFTPDNQQPIQLNEGACNNYLLFIPNNYTPTLMVKLNFHFFRNDDGSGDYQPADSLKINQMIQWLNAIYKYLGPPTIAPATLTDTIYDSKIQFVLKGVYYHNSSQYYNATANTNTNDFYIYYGTNKTSEINVFFYKNSKYVVGGGCASANYVLMHNQIIENYATAQLLAHELGHSLGLDHTWYGQFDDTYYPDDNKAWVQCNNIDISNNIMGYNMCRNYLSPKQMGHMHKCLITSSNRRNFIDVDSIDPDLHIDSSFTMNHAVFFNGNVIIDSGYTLNITCQVYCSQNARIIVRPGGKLIVDGGVLTSAGNIMWKGVIVEGNADSARLERCQGTIILLNGAEISNALCGVNIQGGGIIKATSSGFTNNLQGVAMQEYNHAQVVSSYIPLRKTYFRNCTFTINSNAFFSNSFTHVSLIGIQDAAFVSCSFTDTRNNLYLDKLGTGIYAFHSSIETVDGNDYMFTPVKNLFSGLGTGISVQNSYENTSRISDCRFTNNSAGIHAVNADYLICRDNVFEIEHPIYGIVGNTHGIILEESTQYTIYNNLFSGVGTYSIGISFENTGIHNNMVKRNTFEDLYVACYVNGCNGGNGNTSVFEMKGLAFECNRFLNQSLNDIYVSTGATIHPIQGALWQAAGNYFTSATNIVNNNADLIQYYYESNEVGHMPNSVGNVLLRATQGNSCGDYGYIEGHTPIENVSLSSLELQYNSANDQYQVVSAAYENNYGYQIPTVMIGNQESDFAELLTYQWQLTDICNSAIYKITSDSVFNVTLYETWLERASTIGCYFALAESYFHHNNSAFNSLKNNELSRALNTQDYTNLTSLYALRHAVGNGDLGWKDLDSLSVCTLKQIAVNNDHAGAIAKAVLTAYYGQTYRYDSLHPLFPVISFNSFIQKQFNGQSSKWFPKDAEWIYILPSPSGPEVQPMEFKVVSDTLIQGRQCVATTFQFDPFSLANNIRTICFCEANDSVFFYNPKAKEFQLLYNFNLQKGDEYVIYPSPEQKDDSLVVYVDSVTSVTVDGASLRVQYVHTRSISHADRTNHWQIGWNDKAVIYETIGSLVYFMPQETGWNDMFFDHLCQYSGDGINFKKNSDESCETDGIIEPEKGTGAQLLVYPNPASEYIDVTLSERSAKEGEWLVCNALGEVVFRTAASGEKITRIPLHNLSKGFYFIQYRSGNIVRNGRFAIQ